MVIVAYVLIAFGGLMSLLNWGTVIASWRSKGFVSAVPLVGALPLGTGLALLPETRAFAWLALIADYGALVLIIALPWIACEFWSTSRINLLHSFTTNAKERAVAIKLFRRHIAVISAEFDPPFRATTTTPVFIRSDWSANGHRQNLAFRSATTHRTASFLFQSKTANTQRLS